LQVLFGSCAWVARRPDRHFSRRRSRSTRALRSLLTSRRAWEGATITPSVGVEFDTAQNPGDPNANHVGLLTNGDVTNHVDYATPPFRLNDGVARNVWIEYEATSHLLEVYMTDGPIHPNMPLLSSSSLDFGTILGSDVYVGFTAATGGNVNDHDLLGETWVVPSVLSRCTRPPP
jgi:hypothetical protein